MKLLERVGNANPHKTMEKQRDYKAELKDLLENVALDGLNGAIPQLIVECLEEAMLLDPQYKMLEVLSKIAEKEANKFRAVKIIAEKIFSKNIYSVFEENGKKMVKIEGYFYDEGEGIQYVSFCGFVRPIPADSDEIGRSESEYTKYQDTYSERTFFDLWESELKHYPRLTIENVTENTPCGTYIDMY